MKHPYSGPVKAVILDWAGTTVDHGSLAPVRVLQEVFAKRGVPISEEESRRDMGVLKIDHIRKILMGPEVSRRWREVVKREPTEADVESLFANFVPLQLECLVKYSTVIDGVAETVARLRKRGIKIGSTTGYTRAMLEMILQPAAAQGWQGNALLPLLINAIFIVFFLSIVMRRRLGFWGFPGPYIGGFGGLGRGGFGGGSGGGFSGGGGSFGGGGASGSW